MEADTRRAIAGLAKLTLAIAGLILATVLAVAALLYLSNAARGFWRLLIAVILGIGIAIFGIGFFRQFGNPPPPEEPPTEVPAEFGLVYVCEMCGMELSVVKAAKEKAPKHCGEEMILVRR